MKKPHCSITLSQSSDEVHPRSSIIIFSHSEKDIKNENHSHRQLSLPLHQGEVKKQIFQPNQVTLTKPCKGCGGQTAKTGAGRKPKELSLTCSACKQFIAWLPSNQLKALARKGGEA